jgi:Ca-activated chloride channel family protein
MKQTIAFTQAWSRPYIPTGGAEKVYLLIESRGTKGEKSKDRAAEVKIDKSLNSRI